jgi:hypothetical protein
MLTMRMTIASLCAIYLDAYSRARLPAVSDDFAEAYDWDEATNSVEDLKGINVRS